MANKPITRFEIQYVFPNGDGYLRWKSTPGRLLTDHEVVERLRAIADQIERASQMQALLQGPPLKKGSPT